MLEAMANGMKSIGQSMTSLLKVLIRSKWNLKTLKTSNQDLYILGNGPSLKPAIKDYGKSLRKRDLLCVNAFPSTGLFTELQPNYFLIISYGYFNDQATDYNVDLRKKVINDLVTKTKWPLRIFLPFAAKKNKNFIKKLKTNSHLKLQFFNVTAVEGLDTINHWIYRKGLGLPRPHNVLIPSLFLSINLGYKNIYLLGSDHSWIPMITVNEQNQVLINQKHFYDENSSKPKQMHKNEGAGNRKLHEVLEKFYFSFRSYHELKAYAKSRNSKIINTVSDSFIDAFEKQELKNILNE